MTITWERPAPRCKAVDRTGEHCARPEGHGDEKHNAYNGRPWVPAEPLCLAERKPWSACFLAAGHEGDHAWSYNGAV